MRERSLRAQRDSAVVSGCAGGHRRARYTTSFQDACGGPGAKKQGKEGMKAGPRIGVRLVDDLWYCSLAVVLLWAILGRRLEGGCASSGASGWRDKGSVRSAGVGRRLSPRTAGRVQSQEHLS
jgi:hypothetical protein